MDIKMTVNVRTLIYVHPFTTTEKSLTGLVVSALIVLLEGRKLSSTYRMDREIKYGCRICLRIFLEKAYYCCGACCLLVFSDSYCSIK
jgi:hypothetical protein